MGGACMAAGCSNKWNTKSIHLFSLPLKDPARLQIWIRNMRLKNPSLNKHSRVCSAHFAKNSFERDLKAELLGIKSFLRLKKDAVPTIFDFSSYYGKKPRRFNFRKEIVESSGETSDDPIKKENQIVSEISEKAQQEAMVNMIANEKSNNVTIQEKGRGRKRKTLKTNHKIAWLNYLNKITTKTMAENENKNPLYKVELIKTTEIPSSSLRIPTVESNVKSSSQPNAFNHPLLSTCNSADESSIAASTVQPRYEEVNISKVDDSSGSDCRSEYFPYDTLDEEDDDSFSTPASAEHFVEVTVGEDTESLSLENQYFYVSAQNLFKLFATCQAMPSCTANAHMGVSTKNNNVSIIATCDNHHTFLWQALDETEEKQNDIINAKMNGAEQFSALHENGSQPYYTFTFAHDASSLPDTS